MNDHDAIGQFPENPFEFSSGKSTQGIIKPSSAGFLSGGGEMGELIRTKNWSQTPLGPIEQWPQSLKTIVRIMLTSRQPIWIGWGPELIKLYNDPYKTIVGGKHPEALGQPAKVVWHEIWDDIGPRLTTAYEQNEGTYDESMLLIMERYGYSEETYYTFSYSPVPGDDDKVGGIICANTDDTQHIIGERQVKLLRTLAAETAEARDCKEVCQLSMQCLEQNPHDIPFAMLYLLDQEQRVQLAETTRIQRGHPAALETCALSADSPWPFADAIHNQQFCIVSDLQDTFADLPTGIWKIPSSRAVVVPIIGTGQTGKTGVLIVGLNPFRLFDEEYRGFIKLISNQIAASLANVHAYEEERKRAEALAEIDRAKTLFFSNVSHEFRTPLTLMLGPLEDMLREKHTLSPEQGEHIEIVHRNALRLLKLVNTLLDFSRLEAGRVQVTYEPTNLAEFTSDLVSSFRSAIETAGMQLIVDCPPLSEPVFIDREMWEKIVLNLLSNAFKYTLSGSITVILQQKTNAVELSVKDTGVDIPSEELPHMFDRFHRVKGSNGRTHEGTGIGLSLVQELVKLHGGDITVKSTYGKGSTFTVIVPLGMEHLPQARIASQPVSTAIPIRAHTYVNEALRLLDATETVSAEETAPPTDPILLAVPTILSYEDHKPTPHACILFADDNADMREYVSRLLQNRYQVITVANGKAALEAVQKYHPALVLSDVMMPSMDGFELLQAIRANPTTSTTPVILLSARAGEEAKVGGIEAGADDYLIKPFSARELLARVGTHLEMARIRREIDERFHALAENIPNLVWMARPDGWVYWYNSRWYEYTGMTRQQIEGWGWQKVHDPEGLPNVLERWHHSLQSGEPFEMIFTLKGTDNQFRPFLTRIIPIRDDDGNIIQWFGTGTDITEQKELEQQKDDFISIASHELKTPVTSIKAYTQFLERTFQKSGDAYSSTLLKKMDGQLNRLISLIRDLLDVTKIENGKLQFHLSTFDFNTLIKDIVEEIQLTTTSHTIIQELSPSVMLRADRDRIGQVLTNLLTNAIKYSPSSPTVIVRTMCQDGQSVTSIQDFGIGIPEEKQALVFGRFFRAEENIQTSYPGLGLGLYIAAEFIKRHHGSIWIESEERKGTTVYFSLPLESKS